jgi:predicted Zn-dependent protease
MQMHLNQFKDAIQYFGAVVRHKTKNVAGWEALIRCLIKAEFYDEAMEQCNAAMKATDGKPVFLFYYSTHPVCTGQNKRSAAETRNGDGKSAATC